jgi:fatty acid desaturase
MAPTTDESQEVGVRLNRKRTHGDASVLRAAVWAAAVLAGLAVLGLFAAPSLRLVWIVLLVFAIAAVPQALLAARREERREDARRDR